MPRPRSQGSPLATAPTGGARLISQVDRCIHQIRPPGLAKPPLSNSSNGGSSLRLLSPELHSPHGLAVLIYPCHQLTQEVSIAAILGLCPSRLLRAGSPTVGRLSSNKELPVLSRLVSLSEVDLLRQAEVSPAPT